ncbi:MAG TPA: hypothetical protein VKQ07_00530 [Jatrophihabitantaceae bacterium]|nr:hypothetical protein [Jatrophihabitantaceae bacterium]
MLEIAWTMGVSSVTPVGNVTASISCRCRAVMLSAVIAPDWTFASAARPVAMGPVDVVAFAAGDAIASAVSGAVNAAASRRIRKAISLDVRYDIRHQTIQEIVCVRAGVQMATLPRK